MNKELNVPGMKNDESVNYHCIKMYFILLMVTVAVILSGLTGWIMTPGIVKPFPSLFYLIASVFSVTILALPVIISQWYRMRIFSMQDVKIHK